MRRFLTGFLLALALAVPATLAAAHLKVVNVTNPMAGTLDGGGYDITNVANLRLGSKLTVDEGVVYLDGNHTGPLVMAGAGDPRTTYLGVTPGLGSLYLQFTNPGAVWILVGYPADWRRITTS